MTDRRPEPGSPWERHCPDAFPREWVTGGTLPAGFTRPASTYEADLIAGKMTEAEFLRRTGKAGTPSPAAPGKGQRKGKRKPSPVVRKLKGWNRFFDESQFHEPRLTPLAVALWCWLWRCEQKGVAKTSERMLAKRFGAGRTSIRTKLRELEHAGFLELKHRGMRDHSATIFWVRPAPKNRAWNRPATGFEIAP